MSEKKKEPLCSTCQDRDKKDHESNCSGCYDFRMNYVKDPYLTIAELESKIKQLKGDMKEGDEEP
ncbi:MAG: hypothetical protein ACTSPB_26135 [Candidatus Thorarchaeota archaeon]